MLKKLTQEYINALNSKDLNKLESLLDDDFSLEDPITIKLKGKKDCLKVYEDMFKHNTIEFKPRSIYQDGNVTFVEFDLKLSDLNLRGVDLIIWKDEKILERRAYIDVPKIL